MKAVSSHAPEEPSISEPDRDASRVSPIVIAVLFIATTVTVIQQSKNKETPMQQDQTSPPNQPKRNAADFCGSPLQKY